MDLTSRTPASASRSLLGLSLTLLAISALVLVAWAPPAQADVELWPTSGQWNGQRVYLSKSCHDPDGGPDCQPRNGCNSYEENFWSASWADKAAQGGSNVNGSPLTARGYAVRSAIEESRIT